MPASIAADRLRETVRDVWDLKRINFNGKPISIITQNFNGPCSFIAICNILILRGNITIEPLERTSVSYEFLSHRVAEYLLTTVPDVDIDSALAVMPLTQKGMDLNPVFTGPTSFRPSGFGGELDLFKHCDIKLVHGWLADPDTPEYDAITRVSDYDSSVTLIAEVDHLTKGQLVYDQSQGPVAGSSSSTGPSVSDKEQVKIQDAMAVQRFLESSESQLTYHGLFQLASILEPGKLNALFRGSHLSVLYKSPNESEGHLFNLVTDSVFLHESSIVWERLEDVDGASSFVDSEFVKSSPAGGDFAGRTAEDALREQEAQMGLVGIINPADEALAAQLQKEERDGMLAVRAATRKRKDERLQQEEERLVQKAIKKSKKKEGCITM